MAGIIVYNKNTESHDDQCTDFYIGRGSILGNPYTDKPLDKTLAIYHVNTREEAIARYDSYFDMMYKGNKEYREMIDMLYLLYKNGETIYLGCYCKPLPCHGDIIKKKLEQRLLKEKIEKIKNTNNKI